MAAKSASDQAKESVAEGEQNAWVIERRRHARMPGSSASSDRNPRRRHAKRLTRIAEVRHVTETSIGFSLEEPLPMEELMHAPADPARAATSHVPRPSPSS